MSLELINSIGLTSSADLRSMQVSIGLTSAVDLTSAELETS